MIRSIGMLEFNSIGKGIESADAMVKASDINLLEAKTICPGKYMVIISGDVGAVKASMEAGENVGRQTVVNRLVLPNVHPDLIKGILGTTEVPRNGAVGVLEFYSVASAVVSADIALKAGMIGLIEIRLGMGIGGKSFITLAGDVGSVKEAVQAGAMSAQKDGMLVTQVVIPSLSEEVFNKLL